jgi:hypothetical protein
VRERDIIDAELRLLVAERSSIRDQDVEPGCRQIDELLDERHARTTEKAGSSRRRQTGPRHRAALGRIANAHLWSVHGR